MRFFCQDHKNANVIFEGSLICPLCEAEAKIKEHEQALDEIERQLNAIEAAIEDEIGEESADNLLAAAKAK